MLFKRGGVVGVVENDAELLAQSFQRSHTGLLWLDVTVPPQQSLPEALYQCLLDSLELPPLYVGKALHALHRSVLRPTLSEHSEGVSGVLFQLPPTAFPLSLVSKISKVSKSSPPTSTTTGKEQSPFCSPISFFMNKRVLLSLHHAAVPAFHEAWQGWQESEHPAPKSSFALFYALADSLVDAYQTHVDEVGLQLDALATQIIKRPNDASILLQLHQTQEQLSDLRQVVFLEEGAFSNATQGVMTLTAKEEQAYVSDLYQHLNRLSNRLDRQMNTVTKLFLLQGSLSGQKLNELIKCLTILSVLLLPVNVVTGLFGMNVAPLPLAEHTHGFWLIVASLLLLIGLLLLLFKLRAWI
jgi:magnesium transporter